MRRFSTLQQQSQSHLSCACEHPLKTIAHWIYNIAQAFCCPILLPWPVEYSSNTMTLRKFAYKLVLTLQSLTGGGEDWSQDTRGAAYQSLRGDGIGVQS